MEEERELLKGNTPTLVLAVLSDAPLHGYGIAREIERRSNNALKFKEGTLYPALHALEREGLIVGAWQKENGGRERKVYDITPQGLAALERRTQTWNAFATAVQSVIAGSQQGYEHAGTSSGTQPPNPIPTLGLRPHPEPTG